MSVIDDNDVKGRNLLILRLNLTSFFLAGYIIDVFFIRRRLRSAVFVFVFINGVAGVIVICCIIIWMGSIYNRG